VILLRIVFISSVTLVLPKLNAIHGLVVMHRPLVQQHAAKNKGQASNKQQCQRDPFIHPFAAGRRHLPRFFAKSGGVWQALFARSAVNFDFRVLVEGAFRAAFRVESQILGFDAFGINQLALVGFKEFPVSSHAQA
jgi:hypothetical protein